MENDKKATADIAAKNNNLQIAILQYDKLTQSKDYDIDRIIFDLDCQIDLLSSQADKFDYLVSISSGLLCGLLDVLWVGDFSLERGRNITSDKVDSFVVKIAKLLGCQEDDLVVSVKFLEKSFQYRATEIPLTLEADCSIIFEILPITLLLSD